MATRDEGRRERLAALIDRIERSASAHGEVGGQRRAGPPASTERIKETEALLGFPLPDECSDLYSVADGIGLFGFEIAPLAYLPQTHTEYVQNFTGLDEEGLRDQVWGPEPKGPVVCLAYGQHPLLYEMDGPASGVLTYWDSMSDFGFRPVSPSLEALLETWVGVLESGLVNLHNATGPSHMTASFDSVEGLEELVERLPATIVALGDPGPYDRRHPEAFETR